MTNVNHSTNFYNNTGYVDTHAHLWSNDYLDKLKALMLKETDQDDTQDARVDNASDDISQLAARLAMMDKAGVQYQVLSATPQSPYWGDEKQANELAVMINDLYAQVIKEYPDRFVAYGAVPLPHVTAAISEAKRCINELGFKGIAINTLIKHDISIVDDRLIPFYEVLDEMKAVLYIHPTGCGANSAMVNDAGLKWVVGAPIEDGLAGLQLLKAGIPQKFPNIQFHIAHLGGFLPFMMQRIEDNYNDWDAFEQSPWQSFEQFWFDTANFHAPALRCSCDTFGSERLLLGSDYPYFQHDKYTRAVTYIQQAGLSEADQQAILKDNAYRLFKLPTAQSK